MSCCFDERLELTEGQMEDVLEYTRTLPQNGPVNGTQNVASAPGTFSLHQDIPDLDTAQTET